MRTASTTALPWLTRAYFTAYAAGQILPTSIGGDAMRIFETTRRHPGQRRPDRGLGAARARARRRRDARARRRRARARDRPLRRRRLPLDRGALLRRDDRARARALLALGPPAARALGAAAPAHAPRAARAGRVRGDPLATATHRGSSSGSSCSRSRSRPCACSRSGRPARRSASTSRVPLLRDGAAALPRDARAVHAQRASRCARRSSSASSASSASARDQAFAAGLPLLPRDRRAGAAGVASSCCGRACAAAQVEHG